MASESSAAVASADTGFHLMDAETHEALARFTGTLRELIVGANKAVWRDIQSHKEEKAGEPFTVTVSGPWMPRPHVAHLKKLAEAREERAVDDTFAVVPISAFPPPAGGKIICVRNTHSVLEAADILIKNNVLSAPVVAARGGVGVAGSGGAAASEGKVDDASLAADARRSGDVYADDCVGVVDLTDIAMYALQRAQHAVDASSTASVAGDDDGKELPTSTLDTAELSHVMHYRWGPFVATEAGPETSVLQVLHQLGKGHEHRVFVHDTEGRIINVVTQSAVVDMLADNIEALGIKATRPIRDLRALVPRAVVAKVTVSDTVADAFHLMKHRHISAVPVTNESGTFIGVISIRDVRMLLKQEDFGTALRENVAAFLSRKHTVKSWHMRSANVTCTESTSLGAVLRKLQASRVHRIFVVDGSGALVSVMSLADVISAAVEHIWSARAEHEATPADAPAEIAAASAAATAKARSSVSIVVE